MRIMDVLCASKNNNSTQTRFLLFPLLACTYLVFLYPLLHHTFCLKRLWRDEIYRSFKWDASVSQFLHNSVSSEKLQQLKGKQPLLHASSSDSSLLPPSAPPFPLCSIFIINHSHVYQIHHSLTGSVPFES